VDDPLGDALVVEARELLAEVEVLDEVVSKGIEGVPANSQVDDITPGLGVAVERVELVGSG